MRIDRRLADRIKKINPSQTLAITAKAKKYKSEGRDIVNLAAGEPDFDTPDFVKEAAIQAIKNGFTKYTPASGTLELKKIICEKFKRDNSLDYLPEQIVVSCGAKHSIFNTLACLINRGDEVIIPSPYWLSYPEMVNICEGRARFVKTLPENNFKLAIPELQKHITSKTKLIIFNSPSNPTGCVYSPDELKAIAKICINKKIFVLSDEIYEKLIYDNVKHVSIGSLGKEIYDLTITVNGISKSFSMTGWRIGYLGGPRDIAEAVSNLQDHSTSNPTSVSQKAAVAALSAPDEFSQILCQELRKRRDYLISRLKQIKKIGFVIPQGAFYVFCDISRLKASSSTIADRLLEEASVALIPGEGFGRDDYVRISFATSIAQIQKGMDRFEEWVNKI